MKLEKFLPINSDFTYYKRCNFLTLTLHCGKCNQANIYRTLSESASFCKRYDKNKTAGGTRLRRGHKCRAQKTRRSKRRRVWEECTLPNRLGGPGSIVSSPSGVKTHFCIFFWLQNTSGRQNKSSS